MALTSDLLSGNRRLQQCSQVDSSHVQPKEPASEHVRLIQEALRQVDQANIPAGETDYGTETTKAVINFKTKKNLFTRGTKTIDPIVGIGTIAKLDEGMLKIEEEKRRKAPPKPVKDAPSLTLSGKCQVIGEFNDNLLADDLKFGDPITARKSAATFLITAPFALLPDDVLESTMKTAMFTAVNLLGGTGASLSVRGEALALCDHFFRGGGIRRDFAKGSDVSNDAKTDVGFLNFVGKVRFNLDRTIRAAIKTGVVDDRAIAADMRKIMDAPSFGTGQFGGALAAFIGGFQGYHVEMCGLTVDNAASTFTYSLDIEIFDHFGVDDTDINRKSGGVGIAIGAAMGAFFVLQHDRNEGGLNRRFGKYRPFRLTTRTDMGPFTAKSF